MTAKLDAREADIATRHSQIQREVTELLDAERAKLLASAQKNAEQQLREKMQTSDAEMKQLRERLKQAQKSELELQKQQQELQDRAKSLELDVARKIN